MLKDIKNTRNLTITVPAGVAAGNMLKFPLDNELDGQLVTTLETFNDAQCLTSPESGGGLIVTAAKGAEVTIVLMCKSKKQIYNQPYQSFNVALNSGIPRYLKDLEINLRESYVRVNSIAAIAGGDVLMFGFGYDYNV